MQDTKSTRRKRSYLPKSRFWSTKVTVIPLQCVADMIKVALLNILLLCRCTCTPKRAFWGGGFSILSTWHWYHNPLWVCPGYLLWEDGGTSWMDQLYTYISTCSTSQPTQTNLDYTPNCHWAQYLVCCYHSSYNYWPTNFSQPQTKTSREEIPQISPISWGDY